MTAVERTTIRDEDMVETIAVADLRIGMFVQLDGGWLSHPFPLSAFRITDAGQLVTLQALGLKQVRWIPERSDLGPAATAQADTGAALPAAVAAQSRQQRLAAQRAAAQLCEQQYGEAARSWREACDGVVADPLAARGTTEALASAMMDKMLAGAELSIRLVNGATSDRAAAHALNVAVISMLIGRAMALASKDMLDLGVGALAHDLGKIEMPERLRHQDMGLAPAEVDAYRQHVNKGVLLGQRMTLSAGAMSVLAQHHECADGSGFPLRLTSDRMSAMARIVAIVNRYDNLCNPSTRLPALTPHEAVSTLFAQGGTRFDTAVMGVFVRLMGIYPAGSLVQLTDDRFALVTGVNATRPLKPCVLVHDAKIPREEALLLDLEQQPNLGIRRSIPSARLPAPALAYLDPRPRVSYYFEVHANDEQLEDVAA